MRRLIDVKQSERPASWAPIATVPPASPLLRETALMTRKPTFARHAGTLGLGLIIASATPAFCAPPQINSTSPLGLRRGQSAELTISGANLAGNPRIIAPFGFKIDAPAAKGDASSWKLKLTVDPGAAVGAYPIRVQTDDGISNPILLAIGQLPQVPEKEENSTFETAQKVPDPPLVVEGQVAGNDVDFFQFHGKKGQMILVDAQCARIGSGIDPEHPTDGGATKPGLCRLGR